MYSVIIPTLQRSERLCEVVRRCASHELVLEVLVINNAPAPLAFEDHKVRVLQQERNIFVNPAWNLGAAQAVGEWLAIVNDDVLFPPEALTHAADVLRRGWFGIVGPDRSAFNQDPPAGRIGHRLTRGIHTTHGYGTFMCLRRSDYVPIPDELLIWGGDDWLIASQRRPPASLINIRLETEMGTTSHAPEFQAIRAKEQDATDQLLAALQNTRWWHSVVRWADRARNLRFRMTEAMRAP